MDKSVARKNILFSVHEISPNLGSECSSGWNIVLLLSKYHNLTVLYAETNQFNSQNYSEHIAEYFNENDLPQGLIFIPIKQPPMGQLIAKINQVISNPSSSTGFSILYFLSYRLWQRGLFRKTKDLMMNNNYDIIHQFNALSYREPGYLFKLDLPFIWGPVSGLDNLPSGFFKNIPFQMLVKSILRNFSNFVQFRFSSRIHAALKKASRVYAVTSTDKRLLGTKSNLVINLLDVGTNVERQGKIRDYNDSRKLKIVWIGRLDYFKALDILLNAVSQSPLLQSKAEIAIIGKGPQEDFFKDIEKKLGLSNIQWLGHVDKVEVEALMLESDLLVHTSIKEAASAVILESLSSGLPIVCHNSFGMSHAITKDCGMMVDFKSAEDSIRGFKSNIENFIKSPKLVNTLSRGALIRAKELSWERMAMIISDDYNKFAKKM